MAHSTSNPEIAGPHTLTNPTKRNLPTANVDCHSVNIFWSIGIGLFFGFFFGVGCALAVMHSIYMGGYRAAIRDSRLAVPPQRYHEALNKLAKSDRPG